MAHDLHALLDRAVRFVSLSLCQLLSQEVDISVDFVREAQLAVPWADPLLSKLADGEGRG